MKTKNLLEGEEEEGQESAEDIAARERAEAAAAERKALEDQTREAQLARAKAEGELEAHRKLSQGVQQVQPQISEEQWAAAEAQTGKTRQQIMADAQITNQLLDERMKPVSKALQEANDRAKAAEDRAARLEARGGESEVKKEFFESNPQFASRSKEVNEFLDLFPESDKSDPKKLKVILEKSKAYVRGVVGGNMRSANKGNEGSSKLSGGFEEEGLDNSRKIDYTGLDNVHQQRVVDDIFSEVESKLSDKDREALFKKSQASDGRGVSYDSAAEFAAGDRVMKRGGGFGGSK